MRTPRLPDVRALVLPALAAGSLALLVSAAGGGHETTPTATRISGSWHGLVGGPRAQIPTGERMIVVLKAPSVGERLKEAGGVATESQERAWTAGAFATQAQLLAFLIANGVFVQPEFRYARVLNGFSAPLDPRAVGLIERSPQVMGVYPVRAAYPAALGSETLSSARFAAGSGRRPDVELPGYDGAGVTIALLDTGVDTQHPYLHGRVERGFDLVSGGEDAALIERHGTEIGGLVVGHDGPAQLHGVAPGATVLPIRVAGWQPDASGHFSIYARTDQLIAGLERAVDPNEDGDAHDAARIILVPLAIPFAGFASSPEARAVDGAAGLDTVVVVAAGNDGAAGPTFGSIAGPGGASSALTVGAIDARRQLDVARVVLRRGLEVLFARDAPLLNAAGPGAPLNLPLGVPVPSEVPSSLSFFDDRGFSLVARKIALVPAGDDPGGRARAAVRAGARGVLLFGARLPAGGLGLADDLGVPVLSIPPTPALALLAARRAGANVGVSIGRATSTPNPDRGAVAGFSSRGLAFDGRVKPELAAPGVELATSEPEEGYGTVNGTSAAAAVVAGAAALLAEARAGVDAAGLKGLLVGSGRRIPGQSRLAQGGGAVDVGAAAAGELAAEPTSLGFGVWTGKSWKAKQTISVRNISSRRLRVRVTAVPAGGESELLGITVDPVSLVLRQGERQDVSVTLKAAARLASGLGTGSLQIAPEGGRAIHVPWAVSFQRLAASLISNVRLARRSFAPSDSSPTLLSFRAGRVRAGDGRTSIQPVARLDLRLIRADGHWLGVIARLHDVLPGRYAFGLTGRDPQGTRLPPGQYRIQLAAWPAPGGRPSVVTLPFAIE